MLSQMGLDETATEERDYTGDSGIGTGSGATKYGSVEEWRKAIRNPPPVPAPGVCILVLVEQTHFEDLDNLFYRYCSARLSNIKHENH